MLALSGLRRSLRKRRLWLEFQEANREGWLRAWQRSRIQTQILDTPPVRTATSGTVEVRALTWRRDWINLIWALKSFYHYAAVDYPLYIHDGGLTPRQATQLLIHFPQARLIDAKRADMEVERELKNRGLTRSLDYRARNVSTRKLFDFYLFSCADTVLSIDSDIVFFRTPIELIDSNNSRRRNYYNKDSAYWYSLPLDELEQAFGIRPPPLVNSGLALVRPESIDYGLIEGCLAHPKLFDDTWVTEQTLHALCSSVYGLEFLPETYCVAATAGLSPEMICKHYPGFFRYHLYTEGMKHLVASGFLQGLHSNCYS